MSRHIDEDIDMNQILFFFLAVALPLSLAYMRTNVERDSRGRSKFQALRLALESEADFLKEHSDQHSEFEFLSNHQQHSASVSFSNKNSKAPNGFPISKNLRHHEKLSKRILMLEAA